MPRIEDLSNAQRQTVLNFACFEYDSSPFVPSRDPLHKTLAGYLSGILRNPVMDRAGMFESSVTV